MNSMPEPTQNDDRIGDSFPKPVELMKCPAWCTTDHSRYHYDEIENLCEHDRVVLAELDREGGAAKLEVLVTATDDLGERRRHGPGILVLADEPLSPDQAIRMIGAVAEGLRIIAA